MAYQLRDIPAHVFRAYDIRGLVGSELDEDAYYTLGRAFSLMLRQAERQAVYLARDARLSSQRLALALRQGLLDSGIRVIDLGAVTTPVMYYAVFALEHDSGLVVTGSHNPADYNGIKMVLAGKTLIKQDIDRLQDLVAGQRFVNGCGDLQLLDIQPLYQQRIQDDIVLARPLKVVVDCGNGIAGASVPAVLEALGCEVIPLYCEVDGRFPNHHPDPTIEANLVDLKAAVLRHGADLGFGFDGDADRLGLITEQGQMIWPDRLMMLFAEAVLGRNPGGTIVYDVKCSSHLTRHIAALGGQPLMCPTGHSIVKQQMRKVGAVLAGEMSGHIFFKDRWFGFDDALYSACRLLEILSQQDQPASAIFARLPDSVNTPEIKIAIPDQHKFDFMQKFMQSPHFEGGTLNTIDGLRVEYSYGWGLLRASNTTPCLVARFEASSRSDLEQVQQQFRQAILAIDAALDVPF